MVKEHKNNNGETSLYVADRLTVLNHSKRGVYIINSRGVKIRKGSTLAVKEENTNMAICPNKPYIKKI